MARGGAGAGVLAEVTGALSVAPPDFLDGPRERDSDPGVEAALVQLRVADGVARDPDSW